MPRRYDITKVLVIGSGPIVIGQAAEFDYAGTQACRALKEEGLEVVLVNSNPATIMTDANIADRVYIEPLTPEFVKQVIAKERPDGILPTLGGQVGLNMAVVLATSGVLDEYGVKLLGTPLDAIRKGEDRELFKALMQEIGEPIPISDIVESVEDALRFAGEVGYPLIVRPAYTLGGTGGGIASCDDELVQIASVGLAASLVGQVLLERSVAGWKEIEYEVIRDAADNCITVCSMENLDPVGIHTGDSIVVAPVQTLRDAENQMLRSASIKIIRALGVEGGCNVQFALHPESMEYIVIEVNPRVSRSSALASKATGYPIAKVATKVAIGLTLDEIMNAVTGMTSAAFEPAIDYIVLKIPRWPFDKFALADRKLGTQMKATGEVMSIDRTFAGALQKAIRSLEIGLFGLRLKNSDELNTADLIERVKTANDERLFAVAEALRRGVKVAQLHEVSDIDEWYLDKISEIIEVEKALVTAAKEIGAAAAAADAATATTAHAMTVAADAATATTAHAMTVAGTEGDDLAVLIGRAKVLGFADREIARIVGSGCTEGGIRRLRERLGVMPVYKMVDTCAAEFDAVTPYYYSTYDREDESVPTARDKVLVLGSGPIRIGQGVEFDYCSVHAVWALREAGIESIIINNNPETVSTDFDTSDRLYFEPLVFEDVMNVIEKERPRGVVVQFGGQTAINLAGPLEDAGVHIIGTSVRSIDAAEDRKRFDSLLVSLDIPKPRGRTATSVEGALEIAREVGFPVLVRPSYVLGGRAMEIVNDLSELLGYMESAVEVDPDRPVLVDKYMFGKEVEVDAISDGVDILIPGIMEHIERAGVHSGDSIAVYPPQSLTQSEMDTLVDYTRRLAIALEVKGLVNIQFVIVEGQAYIIEVNPRSSRTVPFLSKVTGIPMVKLAMEVALGRPLASLGYGTGLAPEGCVVAVKAPVFSFSKLLKVETSLGPEMKSTGEVMGVDADQTRALYKAILAAGIKVPIQGRVAVTIADKDKAEAMPLLRSLVELGFGLDATEGTAMALEAAGVAAQTVLKLSEGSPNIVDGLTSGRYALVVNTLTKGKQPERDGFRIRRTSVERGITCLTSLDTLRAILDFIPMLQRDEEPAVIALQDYACTVNPKSEPIARPTDGEVTAV